LTEKLLLATNNPGKVREYRRLLKGLPYRVVTLAEEGIDMDVEETGATLEENARLKAETYRAASGLLTLADDSGLEVDALGGEPGPRSARYAGPDASDADRVRYLLSRLEGIPPEKRTARFRCVIAIAETDGKTTVCDGECPGYITLEPRGENGFGYDPVFYLPEYDRTLAELPPGTKNRVSHRGAAARRAYDFLTKRAERKVKA